ncbi:Bifunctional dTDP-4-dehydrorhamnose 3,5-epimerase/dTDP-4-dehydrorhamnose reductase [Glycine max]|nr:Bifunctional dTDP-4-dehydrorhamnose 3,5-epimerase/dTDP-4-dehydrorhamnose reductase [Glycine max]
MERQRRIHGLPSQRHLLGLANIYGCTGWIGDLLYSLYWAQYGSDRLENRPSLEADIAQLKPIPVFNAASVMGRPNVNWCESDKVEAI